MAITFTYSAPLSKPIDLSVNRTASGGAWNAGTYVFRVQTGNNSVYNAYGVTSIVSDPVTIEVQDNDSLTFDFDPVDSSANYFQIFFEKEGHSTSGSWLWIDVIQGSDLISELPATYTAPRHPWYNYTYNEFHLYPYKTFGLSRDKGHFNLEITGDGDFTISDINDFLRTTAPDQEGITWIDGRDKGLYVCGNIVADSFGTGTWAIDNQVIYNIRPIRTSIDLKFEMQNSSWIGGNRNMASTRDQIANFEILNSYLINDKTEPQPAIYFTTDGVYHIIKNTVVDTLMSSTSIAPIEEYFGANNLGKFNVRVEGNLADNTFEGTAFYVKYKEGIAERCNFYWNLNGYMLLCAGNTDTDAEFRDCKFFSSVDDTYQGYTWNVGDEFPLSYLFFEYPQTCYLYENTTGTANIIFSNTLELTVKDEYNDFIQDVSILIVDASGNEAYNGATDSSGYINTYLQHLILEPTGNTARGYNEYGLRKVDKNPYTIYYTKEGYQEESMELNILEKTSNTVILVEPEPSIVYENVDVSVYLYVDRSIQGEIKPSQITGALSDNSLSGDIYNNNLTGHITEIHLSGEIE